MRSPPHMVVVVLLCSASPARAEEAVDVRCIGEVAGTREGFTATGSSGAVVIGGPHADVYRITAEIKLAAGAPKGGRAAVAVMPEDVDAPEGNAAMRAEVVRDRNGTALRVHVPRYDDPQRRWVRGDWTKAVVFRFWPDGAKQKSRRAIAGLEAEGIEPRSWHDRWLRLRVDADMRKISIWLEGLLVKEIDRPGGAGGPVAVQLSRGDRLRAAALSAPDPIYLPVDIAAAVNDRLEAPVGRAELRASGVPFRLPPDSQGCLSLKQARWIGWEQDLPWSHESPSPAILCDPRMPMLRVPGEDYAAAHLLAVADDDPAHAPCVTIRAGRFPRSGNEQNVQFDFFGRVPRGGETGSVEGKHVVQTPAGPLFHVRVPMTHAFAQDISGPVQIELTKEVRLARRYPDPCRFRYRPLGLPSGVRIAAVTLERSPLQMRVTSSETGHAFVEPQEPTFRVTLRNIAPVAQDYALTLQATHLDGTRTQVQRTGSVGAAKTAELSIPVPTGKRGYHDLAVLLAGRGSAPDSTSGAPMRREDGGRRTLLRRETSFALLPPDTRRHRDGSPFGTYDFGGAHYTCRDMDRVGPLYVKMGLRYGMFGASPETRRRWGLLKGNEPRAEAYEKTLARHPDVPPRALIFHETSISGPHITRVPDIFHDLPPYELNEAEEKSFKKLWDSATSVARGLREKHPEVHLAFGNGPLPTKEEFYRRRLPRQLFDSAGNESVSFGTPPESQPPNWLANNASLWMDRRLLDAYGYEEKPVTQCHEVCYPSTNPGNLDLRTQADHFVRHAMHSLAWGVPAFRAGIITDVGGNYRWSHWGSSGFCRMYPEMSVKPAFVAFATMTSVLDGARFVREVPSGSPSLYVLEFARPDGSRALVIWTVRGRRPVGLRVHGPGPWRLVDGQANEAALAARGGRIEVVATPSPAYVVGRGGAAAVEAGAPTYDDMPEGKTTTLSSLARPDEWTVEQDRNPELEYYNFMTPRRKGDFAFEAVPEFEGRRDVLGVTPRPIGHGRDTMPMYAVLAHKGGLPLPGTPTEIGVWINGNSGWGRIIFELTDASGQRWISIGAQSRDDATAILPEAILDRFPSPALNDWNTNDAWGLSRITFDGWRYVGFPVPGNYPGEGYRWPANCNWRSDRDGKVRYPLTLRKLVVELPEKVLHLTTWAPPPRREIYLSDLVCAEGDTMRPKRGTPE